MTTDTSEKGLESLIARHMMSTGYVAGSPADYDREYCLDLVQLFFEIFFPVLLSERV